MSQENVEIVRRMLGAISRNDWDAAFRDTHPGLEVTFKEGPRAGTHRGREVLQEVGDDLRAGFESWVLEPLELIERGDQVVAIVNNRLRPKGGTGGEFGYRNGHIFTLSNGLVLSVVGYPTAEDALEAAGLSE
ncbi:MAG TPA: nuclear transport factor 2 family protein [Solirubrobacterales bacterium]|nr:nuclear transport factor 2 family protein [Solirubrobacterales bacterium]